MFCWIWGGIYLLGFILTFFLLVRHRLQKYTYVALDKCFEYSIRSSIWFIYGFFKLCENSDNIVVFRRKPECRRK